MTGSSLAAGEAWRGSAGRPRRPPPNGRACRRHLWIRRRLQALEEPAAWPASSGSWPESSRDRISLVREDQVPYGRAAADPAPSSEAAAPAEPRAPAQGETPSQAAASAEQAAGAFDEAVRVLTTPGTFGEPVFRAARLVDATLSRLTRRGGALQLEMGHTLVALSAEGHKARLNVSNVFDYAREELGLKSNRARRLVKVAEAVGRRPVLHEAVLRGVVDLCKAEVIIPVARGDAEEAWVHLARTETVEDLERLVKAEGHLVPEGYRSALLDADADQRARLEAALELARFVQGARTRSLRLEALGQEYLGQFGAPECFVAAPSLQGPLADLWPQLRETPGVARARATAAEKWGPGGIGLGPDCPPGDPGGPGKEGRTDPEVPGRGGGGSGRRENDTAGGRQAGDDAGSGGGPDAGPQSPSDTEQHSWRTDFFRHALQVDATLASLAETLDGGPPPPALAALGPGPSTQVLRTHARRLAALLAGWSEELGRLLWVVRSRRVWSLLGFRSFTAYCKDRLLIELRTARYHIRLEDRLRELPALRRALREGRLSFSKAEFLGRHVTAGTVEAAIDEAEPMTLLDLHRLWEERDRRRLAREDEEGNASETGPGPGSDTTGADTTGAAKGNASEQGQVRLGGPESAVDLIEDALLTARIVAWLTEGTLISSGEALARVADHFVEVWRPSVPVLKGRDKALLDRTGGDCAVPGCTGRWQDRHHIVFRSRGGGDQLWNLHPLCRFHHNQALHGGHMRLRGRAGEYLVWELTTSLDDITTFIETGSGASRRVRRVDASERPEAARAA